MLSYLNKNPRPKEDNALFIVQRQRNNSTHANGATLHGAGPCARLPFFLFFSFSFPFLEILPHGIEIIGPARWRKAGAVELQSSNENVQINFNRVVSASCDCIDLWVLLFLRL